MKKAICLFFLLFIFSQISNAQCLNPSVGCSNTDLSNFGSQSTNNFATIEYDNFVSSWHTTVVRTSDGSFQTWGEKIQNSGAINANVLTPLTINSTNYPALTGTPLKAGLGSTSQNNLQGIVLATDGLYAWSTPGIVLAASLTTSSAFQKLNIDGNPTGLPNGVTPGDVKMMFVTSKTLAITTCSGDVWVISQTLNVRGNGTGATSDTIWYKVTTSDAGNPSLTNVVACRGNVDGLMALKSDGSIYVWGTNVLLGNNTAIIANQNRAVQMTLPVGKTPKMIGSTGSAGTRSYYVLATDGNLYSLGNNSSRQLGDWTNANRLSWVQPRYTSATGPVMNDIKWLSPQEHDATYAAINVINNTKKLYAFGNSNNSLIGRAVGTATAASANDPGMPSGVTNADDILAVETGGHTSMIVKACEAKFGYVGHRTNGSMGNGSNASIEEGSYSFATANVQICGAESNPAIQPISTGGGPGSKYCVGDPVLLSPTPAGGTLSILSGPGTLTGNTVNFTAAGTVVVQYSVTTSCGGTSVTSRNFDAALCPLDLEITKTVDNVNASVGTNSTFTITVKNNGPYKATGVTVNDVLPAGYTFVSATPSAGTWTAPNWAVGSLTNGTSATLSIVATVNPSGSYANTATVTGNDPETNSVNNTATATPVVETNLSVTKTASTGTHDVGTNVTFTITASNAGPSNATEVKVSDALPAGYTFVSATPSTGTWLAPDWTIGNLGNGTTATLSIVATVNATGSYANTASITGTQNDPTPGNNSGSVTPTINHAPVATADSYTVAEGGTLNTAAPGVLANDTDIDGDAITAILVTGPTNGTLTLIANGSFVYTHDGSETLSDSFTYKVNDGRLDGNTVTVTITVTAVNDNPVANNDTATTNEDTAVTINVTTNDTDVDGTIDVATVDLDPATAGIQNTFTVTGQGTYTVNNLGVVTFTPVLNYNGTATPINYTVNDNNGAVSNIATISITVTSVNDNPVANNDTATTNEDTAVTINVTTNDTDVDGTIDVATVDLNPATPGIQTTFTVTGQGTYTVNNLGVVTFTPVLNYNGTATPVNYTVNDNNGAVSNIATISITVTSVNDNPVANNDAATTNEDTAVTINVTTNDTDVDGTIDVATVDLDPATPGIQNTFTVTGQGTYTVNNLGVVTFTPVLNYNGTATPINYTVNDNNGAVSNIATISITVTSVNDNPVANNDTATTNEDTVVTINVTTNDTDVDGTIDVATVDLDPATPGIQTTFTVTGQGTYTVNNLGVVTFTPVLNYNGTATPVNYTVNDNNGAVSNIATISITVTSVNDNPVANNDTATTNEDTAVTINVTTNDTDVDGTIDVATVDLDPATPGIQNTFTVTGQGTYTVNNLGVVTFTPVLNYNGTATPINYTVNDNNGAVSNIATISITVTAVNDNPVANNDTATTNEDTAVTINVTTNDTDVDGTIDVATVDLDPATPGIQNTFTVTGQGTYTVNNLGVVTFTPVLNYNGAATPINYTVNDNNGAVSNIATISVTVTSVNDNPVAVDDVYTVAEDGTVTLTPLALDSDVDGDTLSITSINGTVLTGGIQTINVTNGTVNISASGVITFTPALNFNSATPISIPYVISDGNGGTATANEIITVTAVNDNPIAVNDIYTVAEDNTITLTPLALDSDVDGDTLSITSINGTVLTGGIQTINVTNGTVNISATGVITFTPALNFNSATPISIPYVISDGNGGTATANEIITVTAVNDNPVAVDDIYTVAEDGTVTLTPLALDSDVDGDTLSITSINGTVLTGGIQTINVTNGTVNISATGVITFTPGLNFNSATPITIPYVISDGNGGTATANEIITVTSVNDNPVAVDDIYTVAEDNTVTLTPLALDSDVDGDTLSITSINGTVLTGGIQTINVTNGTVNISSSGVITFTPALNFNSATPISIPYVISDGNGGTATANEIITVTSVNDNPVANNDTNAIISSTAGATAIHALTATDVDGTIANYTVLTLPTNGILALSGVPVTLNQVLTPAEAAMLTYQPSGTFTGIDTFTFNATDDLNAVSAVAAITIPVGNNPPTAHDDATNASIPSRAGATPINALTATDTDGTIVSYTVLSLPSNGTLALNGAVIKVNQILTPAQAAMLTYDPSGAFSGNDTFTFTATDNDGAIDASPATVTIVIDKTILNAVADPINSVVGINKIITVTNIFNNDTLNNSPLDPLDVQLSLPTPDPTGILTLKPDGTIELAPNAPAGTYSLTYEICEKANAGNCSLATVTVTVVAPTMTITANSYCSNNTPYVSYNVVADNFTPTTLLTINWIDSANNIVATQNNMPLNGNVLWPGAVVDSNNNPVDWPGWVVTNGQWTQGNDGFELTRPAVTMQFSLNPTQSVVVNYPSAITGCSAMPTFGIVAGNEDDVTLADGLNGSLEVINVLDNDKLNGVPVQPADVILKGQNLPAGITINADGTIDVAPGTKGGSYTLTYQICEVANSSNCTTATVKIFVEVPAIAIVKTVVLNDTNGNGYAEAGETLTYNFAITNKGNTDLENIIVADPLPGIVMSGGPINLAAGQTDTSSITGTYTLTQADVNSGTISNQATASGVTKSGIIVMDKSDSSNLDGEKPTIIELSGCVIKIFNAVSANGDEKNSRFYVQGLECYPENTVQIYNRWGVLVFGRDHYNNNDIAFRGISEGRVTIKDSNGLPEGTYYYIIRYKDKQSNPHQEAGYLYLTR